MFVAGTVYFHVLALFLTFTLVGAVQKAIATAGGAKVVLECKKIGKKSPSSVY